MSITTTDNVNLGTYSLEIKNDKEVEIILMIIHEKYYIQ